MPPDKRQPAYPPPFDEETMRKEIAKTVRDILIKQGRIPDDASEVSDRSTPGSVKETA